MLVLGKGRPFCAVKYEGKEDILPRTGYEISWDAMRVEGSDFFAALLLSAKPHSRGCGRAEIHPRLLRTGSGARFVIVYLFPQVVKRNARQRGKNRRSLREIRMLGDLVRDDQARHLGGDGSFQAIGRIF